MKNITKRKLILNKNYIIYPDVDRALIASSDGNENENFYSVIHPIHAILFSTFTGEKTILENIKQISDLFSISEVEVKQLISLFVNNAKDIVIEYDGERFIFPKKLLIYSDNQEIRNDLNHSDLNIVGPLDLTRRRLSIPRTILFVINTKCVTDCIYCYADKETEYKALSTQRIIEIIEEAKSLGVRRIDVSGGEIFLHKDWQLIVKKLLDNGYNPDLSTKVPLSVNVIDAFEKVGLNKVQISLDSVNSELLEKTLHVANTYCAKMLESLQYINSKGIEIIIKGTQCRYTCDVENIKEVINFISNLENVKRYVVSIIGYSHYKTLDTFKQLQPSRKQIEDLADFLEDQKSNVNFEIIYDDNIQCKSELRNYRDFKNRGLCTANVDGFVLLPDGKITICEELYWNEEFIIGDLIQNSIMDVWRSEKAIGMWDIQQSELADGNPCKTCQDFLNCRKGLGVCWKSVIAHYGEENSFFPDPKCPKAPEVLYEAYYEDF